MGCVFDNFAIDVFSELDRSLSSARGTHPTTFTGERDKERVFAAVTVYPSGTVSEDTASTFVKTTADKVKVLVEGLYYLIP